MPMNQCAAPRQSHHAPPRGGSSRGFVGGSRGQSQRFDYPSPSLIESVVASWLIRFATPRSPRSRAQRCVSPTALSRGPKRRRAVKRGRRSPRAKAPGPAHGNVPPSPRPLIYAQRSCHHPHVTRWRKRDESGERPVVKHRYARTSVWRGRSCRGEAARDTRRWRPSLFTSVCSHRYPTGCACNRHAVGGWSGPASADSATSRCSADQPTRASQKTRPEAPQPPHRLAPRDEAYDFCHRPFSAWMSSVCSTTCSATSASTNQEPASDTVCSRE